MLPKQALVRGHALRPRGEKVAKVAESLVDRRGENRSRGRGGGQDRRDLTGIRKAVNRISDRGDGVS